MATTRLSNELAVLAATRAALDPKRSSWQHDILLSALIEIMARKGPSTQRELHDQLEQGWVGREMTPTTLTTVLETAYQQDLIERVQTKSGKRTWRVTPAVQEEARADREWASNLITDLQSQVGTRLELEFPDDPSILSRARSLTKALIISMIKATRSVFDAVQSSDSPTDLTDVRLNLRAVIPELQRLINSKELAEFAASLALSAASPEEEFGNELLRAIVAGQILHGMVSRSDVTEKPQVSHMVLDTSQLLNLANNEAAATEVFTDFLACAHASGCSIIVTDGVVDEWNNQWTSARTEVARLQARYKDSAPEILVMNSSMILAGYGRAASEDSRLTFDAWASSRKSLTPIIEKFSIRVVDTAKFEIDQEFVELVCEKIEESILESGRGYMRGSTQRWTDAVSCQIVRDFRAAGASALVPNSWFVASDRHTNEAYRRIAPDDDFPLTVTARAWLLYYSAFEPVSKADGPHFAEVLSEDIILESFLSVASAYSTAEMLELGDLLSEGDALDEEDVRATVVQHFLHPDFSTESRAKDLARARIHRQSVRVVRQGELQRERERKAAFDLGAARQQIKDLQESTEQTSDVARRYRRAMEVSAVGVAFLVVLLVVSLSKLLTGLWLVVVWVFLLVYVLEAIKYVRNPRGKRIWLIVDLVGATAWVGLALLLDRVVLVPSS